MVATPRATSRNAREHAASRSRTGPRRTPNAPLPSPVSSGHACTAPLPAGRLAPRAGRPIPGLLLLAACLLINLGPVLPAQRYLPGRLAGVPDLNVQVRRPMEFEKDPDTPKNACTLERHRGRNWYTKVFRGWFLSFRQHVGFSDEKIVRTSWKKYLGDEKQGWQIDLSPTRHFDGLPGLIGTAVPGAGREKGCVVSGVVLLNGGRLFEVRLDVMVSVRTEDAVAFVEDFLRAAVLDPDRPGPLRVLEDTGLALRLPRAWSVNNKKPPVQFVADHPRGPQAGRITCTLVQPPKDPEVVLAEALAGSTPARPARDLTFAEHGKARLVLTADPRVLVAFRLQDVALLFEGTGNDPALERLIAGAVLSLHPVDLAKLNTQAEARIKELNAALRIKQKGETEAIAAVAALTDYLDLATAQGVVERTLARATPRVKEALIRALGARADNATTPVLIRAARRLTRQNEPATLATLYQALGAAARPAAIPLLEAGLRHRHPACVLAAVEALGAPYGRDTATFETLLTFWERLEAWILERPQLKRDVAYYQLVEILIDHLKTLSGQSFLYPHKAREWFDANRRLVGRR